MIELGESYFYSKSAEAGCQGSIEKWSCWPLGPLGVSHHDFSQVVNRIPFSLPIILHTGRWSNASVKSFLQHWHTGRQSISNGSHLHSKQPHYWSCVMRFRSCFIFARPRLLKDAVDPLMRLKEGRVEVFASQNRAKFSFINIDAGLYHLLRWAARARTAKSDNDRDTADLCGWLISFFCLRSSSPLRFLVVVGARVAGLEDKAAHCMSCRLQHLSEFIVSCRRRFVSWYQILGLHYRCTVDESRW